MRGPQVVLTYLPGYSASADSPASPVRAGRVYSVADLHAEVGITPRW